MRTRTRVRGEGVGGAKHRTASLDGIETLPDHSDDGAGSHVLDEAREEGLAFEVSVVCKATRFQCLVRSRCEQEVTDASRGARGKHGRA